MGFVVSLGGFAHGICPGDNLAYIDLLTLRIDNLGQKRGSQSESPVISTLVRTRHLHAIEAKNDMKRVDEMMRMLGIGEHPSRVGIIYFQMGVEPFIIYLNTPVLLRKTQLMARGQVAVGTACLNARGAQQSGRNVWNNRHSILFYIRGLKQHRSGP